MRFIVSGHSMKPTFKPGQSLLVSAIPYLFRKPKIGDVVVVKDPRSNLQTRFVGSNQRLLLKRIARVENERYFVAGDNPNASTDSRVFGPLNKRKILGKVLFSVDK